MNNPKIKGKIQLTIKRTKTMAINSELVSHTIGPMQPAKKLRSISKLTTINNGQRLIFALIKEGHQIIKQILIRKEAIA